MEGRGWEKKGKGGSRREIASCLLGDRWRRRPWIRRTSSNVTTQRTDIRTDTIHAAGQTLKGNDLGGPLTIA